MDGTAMPFAAAALDVVYDRIIHQYNIAIFLNLIICCSTTSQ